MRRLSQAYLKTLAERVNESPFYRLTSMRIMEIDWGHCLMELPVQEKHLQPYGMVHGGVYASLVDAASFWAVFTQIEADARMTSIDLKVNYLASASEGSLLAKGKSIKAGKTLCIGETSIYDARERLLAHGTSTMMVLKDLQIKGQFDLPAKFLPDPGA